MIAVAVRSEGRAECALQSIRSLDEQITGPITTRIIHDDSGDDSYNAWLTASFPAYRVVRTPGRSGFAGAYRSAHDHLRRLDEPFVFSTEDDFLYDRPVDLADMAATLVRYPHLAQLALLRGPVNDIERSAGGVIEQHPDSYTLRSDGGRSWIEHRRFFTTNPSLYPRSLIEQHEWPEGSESEGRFAIALFNSDPDIRSAFWGSGATWISHIGDERLGNGY